MLFEKVDRFLGLVPDVDKASAFFADLFGIHFEEPIIDEVIQMKVVHSSNMFGIELASPMSADTSISSLEDKWIKETGGGVRLIVIKVSNLEEAVERFKQKGLEPINWMIHDGAKEAIFDPKDTFGIQFCLNEYPEITHPQVTAARNYLQKQKEQKSPAVSV